MQSLLASKDVSRKGVYMNVGDRQNTTIWSYPWVPNLDNFLLPHPLQYSGDVQLVADLIDHDALD